MVCWKTFSLIGFILLPFQNLSIPFFGKVSLGEDVTLEAFNRVQILCLAFYGNGIISLSEYAALELLLMICNICNLNSIAKVIYKKLHWSHQSYLSWVQCLCWRWHFCCWCLCLCKLMTVVPVIQNTLSCWSSSTAWTVIGRRRMRRRRSPTTRFRPLSWRTTFTFLLLKAGRDPTYLSPPTSPLLSSLSPLSSLSSLSPNPSSPPPLQCLPPPPPTAIIPHCTIG